MEVTPEAHGVNAIKAMLDSIGLKPSKSKGQNFLVDPNITEKIVRLAGVDKTAGVLEIGPGAGALTQRLCQTAGKVVAVEIDGRLCAMLEGAFSATDNLEIIRGDILKIDIAALATERFKGFRPLVCANLPYAVTTPVLTRLIDTGGFKSITVMVQREVAQRICAPPGSREYGALTVFANYHTEPVNLFNIPPECFYPKPKVHSSVIMLEIKPEKAVAAELEPILFRAVRAAFNQRRKTLVNALASAFSPGIGKQELAGIVSGCGFSANVRGEELAIGDFAALARALGALDKTPATI